jgi:pimeloyl-ACP methyl ester carboxylesterase
MLTTRSVSTPDGRSLNVYDGGDPSGAPILFHHGTPLSGRPYEPHLRVAVDRQVRWISYDRPGYGGSTREAGRAIVAAAADALAIADALGLDRFATWGHSGGGPHALACAARCGDRVPAAATMASVGPSDAPDLDWLAGMGEGNVREFAIVKQGEAALRVEHTSMAAVLPAHSGPEFVEWMRPFLSDVDAAVCDGELGTYLLDRFKDGLKAGVDGWVDDDLAFARPWGFDLAEIDQPVLVLQGRQDLMVPYDHGAWLARNIPRAEAHLSETEGHLTLIVNETPRVLDWLGAHL